jgi:hypothetical protein
MLIVEVVVFAQQPYVIPKYDAHLLNIRKHSGISFYEGNPADSCMYLLRVDQVPPVITNVSQWDAISSSSDCNQFEERHIATLSTQVGDFLGFSQFGSVYNNNNEKIVDFFLDPYSNSIANIPCLFVTNQYLIPVPGSEGLAYRVKFIPDFSLWGALSEFYDPNPEYSLRPPYEESGSSVFSRVYYDLIDFRPGLERLVDSNILLLNDTIIGEIGHVVFRHGNGRDWWLLVFEFDHSPEKKLKYHRFTIEPSGFVYRGEVINSTISVPRHSNCMKVTPDGKKLIMMNNYVTQLSVFDIDRCNGVLSNYSFFVDSVENSGFFFALSPNGRFLYTFNSIAQMVAPINSVIPRRFLQYDLEAEDISASKVQLNVTGEVGDLADLFSLAPNNEIYFWPHEKEGIGAIKRPNLKGLDCQFELKGYTLDSCYSFGTSTVFNGIEYRVGPLDGSACDTLGIDGKPIAFFKWYEEAPLSLGGQFDNLSQLNPDTHFWDFGDGATSTIEVPTHVFPSDGVYNVCLTVANSVGSDTYCSDVVIGAVATQDPKKAAIAEVWPNPASSYIHVKLREGVPVKGYYHLVLLDQSGKMVLAEELANGFVNRIRIEHLPAGTYTYQLWQNGVSLLSETLVLKPN